MPKVPQFESKEHLNGTPLGYQAQNVDKNYFGFEKYKNIDDISKSIKSIPDFSFLDDKKMSDTIVFEAYNSLNDWSQNNLYDSDSGLFVLSGKDAVSKSKELCENLDNYVKNIYSNKNQNFSQYDDVLESVINNKRDKIFENITNFAHIQLNNWSNDAANQSIQSAILNFVESRNDDSELQNNLKTVIGILDWIKLNNNMSDENFDSLKKNTLSDMHSAVLNAYFDEGSLKAKEYFDKNKSAINKNLHNSLLNKIDKMEFDYNVNTLSDKIVNLANNYLDALPYIKDIKESKLSQYVNSSVKSHFDGIEMQKSAEKSKLIDDFYNDFQLSQNSEINFSYLNIPDSLQDFDKLSMMNFVNNNGKPNNDNLIFNELFLLFSNNPKKFIEKNLNEYRGFLAPDMFNFFLDKQNSLNKIFPATQLKDESFLIKNALNNLKINDNLSDTFVKIKNKIREYEVYSMKYVSDVDLKNIISDMGMKHSYLDKYKKINDNLNKKMEFIVDVFNDFEFHKSIGKNLTFDEKEKLISQRMEIFKNQ